MRRGFPLAYPGQTIGLFGGSFDPAHKGHAHVAHTAQKRLALDAVWWLVTPQNPLKKQSTPLTERLASAQSQTPGPKHKAVALETRLGTQFTIDTLQRLKAHYPGVRFIFVMGADGMVSFRRWRRWRGIMAVAPIVIVSRPGVPNSARFAMPFAPHWRKPPNRGLADQRPPAWAFIPARLHPQSSTALRLR